LFYGYEYFIHRIRKENKLLVISAEEEAYVTGSAFLSICLSANWITHKVVHKF